MICTARENIYLTNPLSLNCGKTLPIFFNDCLQSSNMPVNSAQRPGSSQGRGGNTRQEQTNKSYLSEKLQHDDSALKEQIGRNLEVGADVRGILENVMLTIDPNLTEKNVIDLISDYDVTETRELIATLREKISRLADRIANGDDSPETRWILELILASKEKTLELQQDNWTATPPSSDDEDATSEEEETSGHEDGWSLCPIVEDSDDDSILKILKAERVNYAEDQALQTLQKNYKTLKSIKDEDLAETRAIESRPWEKVSTSTIPAASMSNLHPTPPAAEVSNRLASNETILTTPSQNLERILQAVEKPTSTKGSSSITTEAHCGEKHIPSAIFCCENREVSASTESWSAAADVNICAAVSTEGNVELKEQWKPSNTPSEERRSKQSNEEKLKHGQANYGTKAGYAKELLKLEGEQLSNQMAVQKIVVQTEEEIIEKNDLQIVQTQRKTLAELKDHYEESWQRYEEQEEKVKAAMEAWSKTLEEAEFTIKTDEKNNHYFSALSDEEEEGDDESEGELVETWALKGGATDPEPSLKISSAFKVTNSNVQNEANVRAPYGLENLDNTCYMNAVVQSLAACQIFKDKILKKLTSDDTQMIFKDKITKELAILFKTLLSRVAKPTSLFNAICSLPSCKEYANKEQQDCFELLVNIMESWSDKHNIEILTLFEGQVMSQVTCVQCRTPSPTWDPILILKLTLGEPIPNDIWCPSIKDMLFDWSLEEALDENNMFKCAECKKTTMKLKRQEISSAPPILVIQIKRFKRAADKKTGIKLQQHVKYREHLSLKVTPIEGEPKNESYKLKAVITHVGSTISGGHYTAVTKTGLGTADWMLYSDVQRTPISTTQAFNQQAYLLFYERVDYEDPKAAKAHPQPTESWITHSMNEQEDLLGRQKIVDYGEDKVYLKCLLKQEGAKLSHTHMVNVAKTQVKLLGGSSQDSSGVTGDQNHTSTDHEESAKAQHETESKASVESPDLSLRKKKKPVAEWPNPKRRKTIESPDPRDTTNNKPEQSKQWADNPDNVPAEAREIDDTEMTNISNQPDTEKEKLTKDSNTNSLPPTTNISNGTLMARWHTDSAIQKLKNQLDDVPDNGTSDTETHENRAAQQLRIERSMKASQNRKRERTSDDAEQERESDCEKNHNAQSMTDRENKQHTRWKWLPNPTPQIAPYKEQATPQNSQNYIPADADKNKEDPTKKPEADSKSCSNNKKIAEVNDIDMNEAKDISVSPSEKIESSWERLENWKKSVEQQLHGLKKELWEDTQLWRQEIARTTVQQIVSSLQETYTGIFTDVEKLKTTTKELLKVSERQAEAMQMICDKVLSKKESTDLQRIMQQKLFKWTLPSPTPSSLSVHRPPPIEEQSIDKKMDWNPESNAQGIKSARMSESTMPTMLKPPVAGNQAYRAAEDPRNIDRESRKAEEPEIDHFEYLKKCWDEQIGLPLSKPQKRNIYSYKNALVATGYEKILVTWQGMFYEVSEMDIELDNLTRAHSQEYGVEKWVAEGVTVFKWHSRFKHILRPHRFSMKPAQGTQINWSAFKQNKYYIHVYQTKIERAWKDLRTLHSKTIAQNLSQNWSSQYWPRLVDINLIEGRANTKVNRYQSRAMSYHPSPRISGYRRSSIHRQEASEASTLKTRLSAKTSSSFTRRGHRWLRPVRQKHSTAEDISQSELSDSQLKQRGRRGRWSEHPQPLSESQRNKRRRRISHLNNNRRKRTPLPADRTSDRVGRNRVKRSNDLDDILVAIQRVSREVNLLKQRIDRK